MKAIYTLNDFKIGDKVYLLPLNNAASRLHSVEELTQAIQEQTVTKVGSKYITVGEVWAEKRFEHHDNYDGLKEVSNYSPNYELYKSKEAAIAKITREDNVHFLRTYRFDTLSDEALEDIRGIIEALKEGKHGGEADEGLASEIEVASSNLPLDSIIIDGVETHYPSRLSIPIPNGSIVVEEKGTFSGGE